MLLEPGALQSQLEAAFEALQVGMGSARSRRLRLKRAASLSAKMSASRRFVRAAVFDFGELAAVCEHQPRQARLLLLREAGHVACARM